MIKLSYRKFLCVLFLAAHALQADEGLQQFDPEDARFAAAEKWSDGKAILVGGAIGGAAGGLCGLSSGGKAALTTAIVGAVIGGGIEYWNNGRYTKAYDAADGKTIHGAAAANNAQGVQAWVDYGNSAIAQDNDKMTPLMYAAANGGLEAARVVSDNMAPEYEVVDSVTETETAKAERGFEQRYNFDNMLFPEKTKSKSVKKKKLKTADMQDSTGQTAFHWAFDGNHFKVIAYVLIRGKANGNIEDNRGRSIKTLRINGQSVNDFLDAERKKGLARSR